MLFLKLINQLFFYFCFNIISILNTKTPYFLLFSFLLLINISINSQEISFNITSTSEKENLILNELTYLKKHKDTISVNLEINKISDYLKKIGYFINSVQKIKKEKTKYTVYFSLKDKLENAIIKISNQEIRYLKNSKPKKKEIIIPITEIETTLFNITKKLEKEGKSFSKVQLKNIIIKDKTIFADLHINESKKRKINKVIIKGYVEFPKSYLKNYFNITSNTVFNQKKIEEISIDTKKLQFVSEIKKPEILFTKDSTLLYLFLKKKQNNSFDGIVNFSSKEDGGILFNGNLDLKLNNILNTGEKFNLFWNSIGEERQEFKITTEIPYIFNSVISPELSFSIYKQDSSFINTKFYSSIKYNLSNKLKIGLSYSSESSEDLSKKETTNKITSFDNSFIGLNFLFLNPKNDEFHNNKFYLEVNPFLGKRKIDNSTTNQYKVVTTASYIWDINNRNSVYIRNETGVLNSDTFLNNELFRIGGANSLRGFNEQSIFTREYTYFNFEYRYLTSTKSYLYTITDIGKIKEEKDQLISYGLGYLFKTSNSQININITVGEKNQNTNDFNNSRMVISWINIF